MEWLCWLWWFDPFPRGSASPSVGSQGEGMTRAECPTTAQPTAVDVWLIQLILRNHRSRVVLWDVRLSARSGAPSRVIPTRSTTVVDRVNRDEMYGVEAAPTHRQCTETSDGLELGPFCPSRAAQEAVLRV
jgi:hypothetical protein